MRIRKLAKLNATSLTSVPQVHVCHFNQSPWDLITHFSPPSSPIIPQVNGNGNGLSTMNQSSSRSISIMEWEGCGDDVTVQEFELRNSNESSEKKKKKSVGTEGGKRRVRTKKPSVAAANPYDIYYYSGFGPRWGKKRGEDKEDNGCDNNLSTKNLERERVKEPSKFINEGVDYIEEDEDDDEEVDGLGQRKRARKPIKARSLKSLM